ncbi:hypothetical protein GCM10018962_00910 [Dactylosporangium matsuzakiense]
MGGATGMTRSERERRQMNRRIREALTVRRLERTLDPATEEPAAES